MSAMLMWTVLSSILLGKGLGPPSAVWRKLSGGGGSEQVPKRLSVGTTLVTWWSDRVTASDTGVSIRQASASFPKLYQALLCQ
jgi:hypothetical protein